MVNKFGGGSSGKRGPPGPVGAPGPSGKRGRDGLNYARWLPKRTLEWFRETEDCSFYFDSKTDGFVLDKGKIVGLKNHSKKITRDAMALSKVGGLSELHRGGYALDFKTSLYTVKGVRIAYADPSYALLAITFKVIEMAPERQYMISTQKLERGLTINGPELEIWGTENEPLKVTYVLREWNTVYIQWTFMGGMIGHFSVNENEGTFVTSKKGSRLDQFWIGARQDKECFFTGDIAILEIYSVVVPPEDELDRNIRGLILSDQEHRVAHYGGKSSIQ